MKPVLLYILLSFSMVAFAQQAADETEVSTTESESSSEIAQQTEDELNQEEPDEAGPSDSDFKPDEEISEDYPIPLPSDI
jgi:hypothetical protein